MTVLVKLKLNYDELTTTIQLSSYCDHAI